MNLTIDEFRILKAESRFRCEFQNVIQVQIEIRIKDADFCYLQHISSKKPIHQLLDYANFKIEDVLIEQMIGLS